MQDKDITATEQIINSVLQGTKNPEQVTSSVAEQMATELSAEQPDDVGSDGYYEELSNRIVDAVGPEEFFALGYDEAMKTLNWNNDGINSAIGKLYNSLEPEDRPALFDAMRSKFVANNDIVAKKFTKTEG